MSIFSYSPARALAQEALDHRALRRDMIASNIANVSTPMYRPKDVNFEQMMALKADEIFNRNRNLELNVAITNKNHLLPAKDENPYRPTMFYRDGHLARNDGNSVDLDIETSEMGKNDIMYQALVGALRKQGGIYTYAIDSSRNI
ncbi:flagellar basal body rod protein FlgB [Helicobacter turcicus]|uniref:Flagellar basal body rod protein FlgB n=1 Tax=Helicobacter turcicus TaxID=2867412 RepID=A0ABS7JMJ7_9HELI|nr:flagellar basal body rod protein FlgB [Helicobacter turcicus]MBX7490621.1 flagellar basal body rod protein FlgB [Helicobacter turcicus]MBX7545471.1 flagellar basal body rod protein FlgB [Helicobacter turcicus]